MDITGKTPIKRSYDPLGLALIGAILIHALVILGITFDIQRKQPPTPERTVDITLVTPPKEPVKVKKPDLLAQASQLGGGEKTIKQRDSSPLGNPNATPKPHATPELVRAGTLNPQTQKQPQVLTARDSQQKRTDSPPVPPIKTQPRPNLAQLLNSTQREIDRLTADISRQSRAASSRERRKAINASTQEYQYAAYLEAWRKKVERIGNLNYPDEAVRRHLSGSLVLHVAVRANGTIEQVQILRSSGHKVLDDAAKRIVRLAAPYAPFPPSIRKDVDVLDITRTWQFSNSNSLFSTN